VRYLCLTVTGSCNGAGGRTVAELRNGVPPGHTRPWGWPWARFRTWTATIPATHAVTAAGYGEGITKRGADNETDGVGQRPVKRWTLSVAESSARSHWRTKSTTETSWGTWHALKPKSRPGLTTYQRATLSPEFVAGMEEASAEIGRKIAACAAQQELRSGVPVSRGSAERSSGMAPSPSRLVVPCAACAGAVHG
jgi:hypothetical protein